MKNIDSSSHIHGLSTYVDDLTTLTNTVHGVIVPSTNAHAKIISINLRKLIHHNTNN